MDNTHPDTAVITDAIENAFGLRWGVWLSDTGRWWATRRHPLSPSQTSAGCVPFLHADDPDQLAALMTTQDERERRGVCQCLADIESGRSGAGDLPGD